MQHGPRISRDSRISRRKAISMRPRSDDLLGPVPGLFLLEEESVSLACASAQGRRRAARVQSDANIHRVGCSWSARLRGVLTPGSAGPTTPPRFEPRVNPPLGRQTGEPTVSHEGGNDTDSFSTFLKAESHPLACASAQGWRRATRVQSDAIHHKVACSWSASPELDRATG